jgi:predicted ribosomally synthesized peptide with nif11-like leader
MSGENYVLKNVKAFYERLASDEVFRAQIQGVNSKAECSQIVKDAGYDFTQEEFAEFTAQLLEPTVAEDGFRDLNEKELEAVFGGAKSFASLQPVPPYGVVIADFFKQQS